MESIPSSTPKGKCADKQAKTSGSKVGAADLKVCTFSPPGRSQKAGPKTCP